MSINNSINRFFNEFADSPRNLKFWAVMLTGMMFLLLAVYSNFRNDTDISFACIMYIFMIIMCAIISTTDKLFEKTSWSGNILSGKHKYFGLIPFIIGGIFGYFMVTQNQTIGLSFLQLSGINAFAFIVIVAPVVEEWFFRWSIFPSFREQLKGLTPYYSVIALLIANVGFGIFHFYVYGANIGAVYVAAFLGIVYTIGNYALKSGTFSIGAHATNNLLLWIAAGGMLG
jgi:hypothetical protein